MGQKWYLHSPTWNLSTSKFLEDEQQICCLSGAHRGQVQAGRAEYDPKRVRRELRLLQPQTCIFRVSMVVCLYIPS